MYILKLNIQIFAAYELTKMAINTALVMVLVLVILFISIETVPGKKLSTYDALCLTCCEQGPQSCYAFNICSKDYNCSQFY